ncbi:hypothetical protein ETD83_21840 [Actinomadura soli]|uniref:Uncharacterized protein n=1 Tax=Actinomadura soli TaxID=2508997 RepID=A0A5C4J9P2_9ACTN|nr:hypothetical protein ETD83_21840 [Actinomadura soli]
MRHNGQPVILASSLPPNLISLSERSCALVACPTCGAWKSIKRGMVTAHRGPHVPGADAWPAEFRPSPPRCPGSGQRVRVDLSVDQWRQRLADTCREAGRRRPTRVIPRPKPPVARAVVQLAAR